jgi:hypothetical protein
MTLITLESINPRRRCSGLKNERRSARAKPAHGSRSRRLGLDVKTACLCERVAQRALSGQEDGTRVDTGEGRVADVMEEVKVVVGHHGEETESRGGGVDG